MIAGESLDYAKRTQNAEGTELKMQGKFGKEIEKAMVQRSMSVPVRPRGTTAKMLESFSSKISSPKLVKVIEPTASRAANG